MRAEVRKQQYEVEVMNMLFVHVDQHQCIASATEDARDARKR